jgi:hypothetical protein
MWVLCTVKARLVNTIAHSALTLSETPLMLRQVLLSQILLGIYLREYEQKLEII